MNYELLNDYLITSLIVNVMTITAGLSAFFILMYRIYKKGNRRIDPIERLNEYVSNVEMKNMDMQMEINILSKQLKKFIKKNKSCSDYSNKTKAVKKD